MDADPSDAVLLREFATSGDEVAFRALVRRYQDMVFSAARRRLSRDDLAADVAQNVFIALARKAAWLSGRASIGGWLYKATLMESIRRQRDDARRANRERDYAEAMNKHSENADLKDSNVADLLPVLDDAMAHLPQDDREALVLRFLRGLSLRETGNTLGTTEEAARKRVSRALEKLERLFRRRGLALPAAVLASTVLPRAVDAAPASLAASVGAAAAKAHSPGLASSLYLKALALTKVQAVALCTMAAAVPVAWQWTEIRALTRANHELAQRAGAAEAATHAAASSAPTATQPADLSPRPPAAENSRDTKDRRAEGRRNGFWEHHALQRQRDRERRLATLRAEIGLDEAQLAAVTQAIEAAETERQGLWQAAHEKGEWPDREADAAISKGREEAIVAVMSDEQKAAYAEFLDEDARNKQEIYASDRLSAMQRLLHLTDEQKDQVFSMFAARATEAGIPRAPRHDEPLDEGQVEQLKTILTDDQFRIWQRDVELSAQAFPPRGPVPPPEGRKSGTSPPSR